MSTGDTAPTERARPLRSRLLLLAASGLLPLVLLLAWGLNHLVEEQRVQAERSVLELSRALATAVDAELRSIVALLEQLGTSDELEQADLRSFHLSARRAAQHLGWRQVVLSDAESRVLLRTNGEFGSASPTPVEPDSVEQVIRTQKPYVSRVVQTPQQRSDTFAVRVPVIRGGRLVYVLTAVMPNDVIVDVLTRQEIPPQSVASVFDQANRRVARSRSTASPFPTPSLQAMLDRGGEQGVGRSFTREGVDSYTGFTRLQSGWVVAVGTSVAEANKGLYALLRAVALGLAASLTLSGLLALLLSRRVEGPINELKEGAVALGRGDPVQLSRLGVDELDEVAAALNAAAADRDRAGAQVREALRTAEDANRSKDQFLAVLGHELRNPLAPIATAVQLMSLKGDAQTEPERRIIERQLVHVTRLVDDLLDVSRITSGRLSISHEPVRLAEVLAQVVDTIRQSLFERSLSLEVLPRAREAWVSGDEVRLAQVFNNLLVNAIKFTPPGGAIRVKADAFEGLVRVDVEDTGVGLTPAELARIFELFYQAPQSFDRARGGLGLGLPIVRSLVEMHGGRVRASSAGPGRGACITVELPLCEAPADKGQPPAQAPPSGAGRILVVDDNEDAADTCASLLEISGYTVRVAYTPAGALEVLREFAADVAILDIGLPGMSGYELAALLKSPAHDYHGRLVALTGYGQAADIAASQEAGFDAHLTKPVAPGTLLELVGKLCAGANARAGSLQS
jgi:signal transduction histidine kinase/ActR/RegA family two-component response regulator